MCRGVTRLDGAWDKKKVWRPHIRTWGIWQENVLFWKSAYGIVMSFAPTVIRRPGNIPLAPLVTSLVLCYKNRKNVPKINKFSYPNVMNFYFKKICNFRTQYGMDLAQTASKGCWRQFRFLRVVFVSLLCLPHAFFRRGAVSVLRIIKVFRHSASYFFKVRLVWAQFRNCFEGRFCSGNVPVSLGNGKNAI